MNKFNPGDLALTLVSLRILPAGSVVELNKAINPGDKVGQWHTAGVKGWYCTHADIGDRLPFAETSLMPLRGDFATERQKSSEVPA